MGLGVLSIPNSRSPFTALSLCRQLVVALIALVAIGGATRVMEAGLACPDWPLCYGSLLPAKQMSLQVFLEWFHRLDAFFVGIGLIVLLAMALIDRDQLPRWLPWVSGLALLLVAAQGALGALTVTQLLRFDIVSAHLATALLLVALLSGTAQMLQPHVAAPRPPLAQPLCAGAGLGRAKTNSTLSRARAAAGVAKARWAESQAQPSAKRKQRPDAHWVAIKAPAMHWP